MEKAIASVLKGNLEALDQCAKVLALLSPQQYTFVQPPVVTSPLGSHFRHILDIYRALMLAFTNVRQGEIPVVNYDTRRRGSSCEQDLSIAKSEFAALRCWLQGLTDNNLLVCVQVKTEVTLEQTESVQVESTLLRELIFASSHAVHHLAIISMVAKLQNLTVESRLGVAPATATFLRAQDKALV